MYKTVLHLFKEKSKIQIYHQKPRTLLISIFEPHPFISIRVYCDKKNFSYFKDIQTFNKYLRLGQKH
jgi:hypothetical protein